MKNRLFIFTLLISITLFMGCLTNVITPPVDENEIKSIAMGGQSTLVLKTDGSL